MPTPVFPIAAKLLHDIAVRRDPGVLETDTETGPAKVARIRARVMVWREVQYAFGALADYQAFIAWFTTEIERGALWFNWPDPADADTVKLARLRGGLIEDEKPDKHMETWVLKFQIGTWD
jgi:hypothetical protein